MEYKFGKPISGLLSEFLRENTKETDCIAVVETFGNEKSISLINQLRLGKASLAEGNEKYIEALLRIAISNHTKKIKRFEPLLNDKKQSA